jgi:hypothetical protein
VSRRHEDGRLTAEQILALRPGDRVLVDFDPDAGALRGGHPPRGYALTVRGPHPHFPHVTVCEPPPGWGNGTGVYVLHDYFCYRLLPI